MSFHHFFFFFHMLGCTDALCAVQMTVLTSLKVNDLGLTGRCPTRSFESRWNEDYTDLIYYCV